MLEYDEEEVFSLLRFFLANGTVINDVLDRMSNTNKLLEAIEERLRIFSFTGENGEKYCGRKAVEEPKDMLFIGNVSKVQIYIY